MNNEKFVKTPHNSLTDDQITDLARPLKGIVEKFYQDPKNEEAFQKWLLRVEEQKRESMRVSRIC